MSTSKEMREITETYFRYVDSGDFDKLPLVLAEDIDYYPIGRPPVHGVQEVLRYYKFNRVVKDSLHEITDFISEGKNACALLTFTGHVKDGTKKQFNSVDVMEFDKGKIKKMRLYTDLAKLD